MFSIFNLDNPIMQFMGKVFDVLIASILWLICCIPIVTIGASTTAMYYVTLKIRSVYKELHADHETGTADNK